MNKIIFFLGFATLFVFGITGALIIEFFQEQRFFQTLMAGWKLTHQLFIGGIAGLLASGTALFVISSKFFEKEKAFYHGLIAKLEIKLGGIIFLSLCAGIGEEIFFRAAIQPFLGIGLTSVLFVLLHGYLNPQNIKISIYGLLMVIIIIGFGYLFKFVGLVSAITAHTIFDVVLFIKMTGNESIYHTTKQ